MTIARPNEVAKIANIAVKVVDYVSKMDQAELNKEIQKIRNNLSWGSYVYSWLPKYRSSSPQNQTNLDIVKDIVKDACTEKSVNAHLLRLLVEKSASSDEAKQLQQAQIENLNKFVYEKTKFETQSDAVKKSNISILSKLAKSEQLEEKKVAKTEKMNELSSIKARQEHNSQLSKLLNIDAGTDTKAKCKTNHGSLDKNLLFSKDNNKHHVASHNINQPSARGFKR